MAVFDSSAFANEILETVGLPLIALDGELRVQIANDAFLRKFEVTREETIGHLVYDLGNGQWDIPELRRLLDEILEQTRQVENYRVEHTFERIGRRVMRLNAKRINGSSGDAILIAISDDTVRERLQFEIEGRIEFSDKLIDSVREGLLILRRDLRVQSANQPFYDLFKADPAATEGRLVYDLGNGQWDIPELRRLLEDILPNKQTFDDYEVRHTFEAIGPRIMLLNGRRLDHLDLVLLAIRDITEQQAMEQARVRREAALRESEELQRQAMAAAHAGSWKVNTVTGEFAASDRALELHGLPRGTQITHQQALARIHPDDRKMVEAALRHTIETGEPFKVELRARQSDGSTRWIASYAARHMHAGQPVLIGLVHDISERKRHEEQTRLLMREINHRSKNMLALIQAIAHRTVASIPDDFLNRFDARMQSLAAAQDLLVRSEWKAIDLSSLVQAQLEHFSELIGRRIKLSGPEVQLAPGASQTIGMALHELATNAAKYGALSNDTGRVELVWKLEGRGSQPAAFVMSWTEGGGPTVTPPARRGFGSSVILDTVEASIDGSNVEMDYAPSGVTWRLTCPARHILHSGEPATRGAPRIRGESATQGRRILVVEDEPLLANHLASVLTEAGFVTIGPAGNVAQALALIENDACDVAVLDVNLRNETSEAVAERLISLGIPFVAVSGYSYSQLPRAFQAAPLFTKPLRHSALIAELNRLFDAAAAGR